MCYSHWSWNVSQTEGVCKLGTHPRLLAGADIHMLLLRCQINTGSVEITDFSIFVFSPHTQTVVGTDLAELLLRDHKTVWLPGKSPNEANLIDFTNEALEQVEEESGEAQLSFLTDNLLTTVDSFEKETERFRELLLYGRKKVSLCCCLFLQFL